MFCGKCGAKIDGNPKFCPQCGNVIDQNSNSPRHDTTKTQATTKANARWKLTPPPVPVSNAQKVASAAYEIALLPESILWVLWNVDTILISGPAQSETTSLAKIFGESMWMPVTLIFWMFAALFPNISYIWHVRKGTGRIPSPSVVGLFLIWNVVFYVMGLATTNDDVAKYAGLLKVTPNALGWLYIMCCIALAGLVIFLTISWFKELKKSSVTAPKP